MKTRSVVVDAGPLVAALDRRDAAHRWVTEQLKSLTPPLLVCEPVLTEVAFLVRRQAGQTDVLLGMVSSGAIRVAWSLDGEVDVVRRLLHKYADQPMSLADACVVRMAELFDDHAVFTLDADFAVYRTSRNQPLRLIVPDAS